MKKMILAVALVVFSVVFTGLSYAYWDDTSQTNENTINIGEKTKLVVVKDVVASVPINKTLVPGGVLLGKDDIDSIDFFYNVNLTKVPIDDYYLNLRVYDIMIGGNLDINELIVIRIEYENKTFDGNLKQVKVILSIKELSEEENDLYLDIKNKIINFKLEFSAVASN